MNYKLALLNSLEKMKELRVLESGVRVVHHYTQHGLGAVQNIFLLLIVGKLCLVESILHEGLILPAFSLLLELDLFELLIEHVFFHFHSLLSLHPLMLVKHFHLFLHIFLLEHSIVELLAYHVGLL